MATTNTNTNATAGNKNTGSNVNPMEHIIKETMSGAQSGMNRQAKMVKYLFDDAANYGEPFLNKYLSLKGGDKVAFVDKALSAMSHDYLSTTQEIETLKEKKGKTKQDALKIERLNASITAVREMFKRSVTSIIFLRSVNATELKVRNDGSIVVNAVNPETNEEETDIMSGRALKAAGDKEVAKRNNAGKPKTNGENAEKARGISFKTSMENATKILESYEPGKALEDLSDELEEAADKLLVVLLKRKFAHAGKVDARDVTDYIKDNADAFKEQPAKTAADAENVKNKNAVPPKQEEKKAAGATTKH